MSPFCLNFCESLPVVSREPSSAQRKKQHHKSLDVYGHLFPFLHYEDSFLFFSPRGLPLDNSTLSFDRAH